MQKNRSVAIVCLLVAMLLWGSSFAALKIAFAELTPMWVIFARMAIGSAVFLGAWRWRGRCEYRRGDWKYLAGLAVCEPCLYFIFEALALQNTSAAQAGMITALLPLMVAVGAYVFLHERIGRMSLSGFVVAVAGVVWLSLAGGEDAHARAPLLGNFFEFLAMCCAVGYVLTLKYLSSRYSAFMLTAMQAFVGAPFFLVLALVGEALPTSISATGLAAVAYLGAIVTVGAYGLYNFAVGRLPASEASAFVNLIPLFSLAIAVTVLGESFSVEQMGAAAVVFIGVALSQWRARAAPVAAVAAVD